MTAYEPSLSKLHALCTTPAISIGGALRDLCIIAKPTGGTTTLNAIGF